MIEFLEDKDLVQKIIDREEAQRVRGEWLSVDRWKEMKFNSEDSLYDSFFTSMTKMLGEDKEIGKVRGALNTLSINLEEVFKDVKPSKNLDATKELVAEKYPLLLHLDNWRVRNDSESLKAIKQYVNLIDSV